MTIEQLKNHLDTTCHLIGASFTLEEAEANGRVRVLATSYRDVIEEYFMTHQHLKRELEGRLIIEE